MNKGIKEKELLRSFPLTSIRFCLSLRSTRQASISRSFIRCTWISALRASRRCRLFPPEPDASGEGRHLVLDFVNEADEIREAFKPYYEQTIVGERAETRHLYELQARLDSYHVFYKAEVEEFSRVFYKPAETQNPADHAR